VTVCSSHGTLSELRKIVDGLSATAEAQAYGLIDHILQAGGENEDFNHWWNHLHRSCCCARQLWQCSIKCQSFTGDVLCKSSCIRKHFLGGSFELRSANRHSLINYRSEFEQLAPDVVLDMISLSQMLKP